jgi:putative PIN family toxin of toxin-antitoxin system
VCYVFDTNVLVSVLLFENSKPAQAFRYVLANGEILLSLDLLEELNEVLGRKRLNRYLTTEEREEFLEALIERAVLVEITETVHECRDPKDDLELALNGQAQYIISGDQDLLVLHPFREVVVISPDEFLKMIEPK